MSCYMVGHDHIDALVTAAASVCQERHDSGLRWGWFPDVADDNTSGEFMYTELGYADSERATEVGQMLMRANLESVCARYSDCEPGGDLPGTIGETDPDSYEFHRVNSYDLPPETQSVVILKALACFEYQACEFSGWRDSEAYAFCDALRHKMVNQLPGYSDAKGWEFTRSHAMV
jgi:hypothetical protein